MSDLRQGEIVLIYLLSLSGGAGRNAVTYANAIAQCGHTVTIVCGHTRGQGLEEGLDACVTFHELGVQRNFRALNGLARVIRSCSPERALIVGPSNLSPFILAAIAARFHGEVTLRVADSPTGMQTLHPQFVRFFKRSSFALALRRADRLIALTWDMVGELEQVWGVARQRIHYIPNGVVLPQRIPERAPAEPPVVLCVARLVPQKDHVTLIRAFAILRRKHHCRLWLAGDGRERERLENLASSLGISDDLSFLGHVTDVVPLYKSARVTALASLHEGFPNVLIESLAYGCPVVATDCPTGPAEIIRDDSVGYLAEQRNPEDLADKIARALEARYDTEVLRARAETYSVDSLINRIHGIFGSPDACGPDQAGRREPSV